MGCFYKRFQNFSACLSLGLGLIVTPSLPLPLQKELPKAHYVVQANPFVRIDWTEGKIYVAARNHLKKVQAPALEQNNTGSDAPPNITKARSQARQKTWDQARLKLSSTVYDLRIDPDTLIRDRLRQDLHFRNRMGALSSRFLFESRRTGNGYVSLELSLPFRGPRGLYALLADGNYHSKGPPEIETQNIAHPISGLILVIQHLSNFQPSLSPRIYSREGLLIYAPETVGRRCFMQKGPVSYRTSMKMARDDPRAGLDPYLAYVANLRGTGQSDLVLDDSDVEHILGSPQGRRALRLCRVILVVPPK